MSSLRIPIVTILTMIAAWWAAAVGQDKPPLPPEPEPAAPWKARIRLPEDPFLVHGTGRNEPAWVKFTLVLQTNGDPQVYFQDGHEHLFHYPFAVQHLAPFAGMTPEQFDLVTLYRTGRRAVLGAVLAPALMAMSAQPREYGIQLVGHDPFTREEVLAFCNLITRAVETDEEYRVFYFPTYEQQSAAQADRAWLEAQGLRLSSPERWADGDTVYSSGWALGVLKHVEGRAIREAYLDGALAPGDLLLTDGVPAETPFLAGILTLSPSTPNSHVAILAKTAGVPFVHLVVPEEVSRARELVGHRICLRAYDAYGWTTVRLIDTEGILDEQTVQEILTLKGPATLDLAPVTPFGSYGTNADALVPADIRYFGGKAANFGVLRRAIPEHAPVAAALSFDLWTDFLAQRLADGRTLRETLGARLAAFQYPPASIAALSAALADLRDLFTDDKITGFSDAQRQAVLAVLQDPQYRFEPARNLRFRSSTNVEDGREFTGAGLYESYSGCLADELDGDSAGPCRCDPDRARERGVFTAIRKVFASFYNENAFLERLRHGLDESQVGMALLVHHSFPDEFELANGVAVLRRDWEWSWDIALVTQAGATSVTNPQDGSIPEEVSVMVDTFGSYAQRGRQSNLVQLGATVLTWEDDYHTLAGLLVKVGEEFARTTGRDHFVLEMEYKKLGPTGDLVVKQVREVPQPDATPSLTPFLLEEPAPYCLLQGEFGNVFANHRLKSRWQLQTRSLWLAAENLANGLYGPASFEYLADGAVATLTGRMSDWPAAAHDSAAAEDTGTTTDAWRIDGVQNPRTYRLHTRNIPLLVSPAESPVLTLQDLGRLILEVEYDKPVWQWDWTGLVASTVDQAALVPCVEPSPEDLLQERRFNGPGGVVIETTFYWPPMPKGPTAGYTAPLARWVETRIAGYTSEPLVLRGYYSQTYRPEHHNFSEHFLFEPQLEPGLTPEVLAQLREKNIRLIHVRGGLDEPVLTTYGYNDEPSAEPGP